MDYSDFEKTILEELKAIREENKEILQNLAKVNERLENNDSRFKIIEQHQADCLLQDINVRFLIMELKNDPKLITEALDYYKKQKENAGNVSKVIRERIITWVFGIFTTILTVGVIYLILNLRK